MRVWITGYIGSGKSTLSAKLENVFEFDLIEKRLKDKGLNISDISKKEFKVLVKDELKLLDNVFIEGIQCCDYYTKGDKIYFVRSNFLKSTTRAIKRDGKRKFFSNIFDNIVLFFRLKKLYFKAKMNGDIIKNLFEIEFKN